MVDKRGPLTRDEKLENIIMNHTMILMGMFEEGFSSIAEKMAEVSTEAPGGGGLHGLKGSPIGDADETVKQEISPEVKTQIGHIFSGIREEIESQWPTNAGIFRQHVSSPAFDKGIEIVERYDFGRPRLAEKLSDEVLASYVFLAQSGDQEIGKMFKELSEWQRGLPKLMGTD
jgi:hypothetical protein